MGINTVNNIKPPTIIIDIDGTIFHHHGSIAEIRKEPATLLPGVEDRFTYWNDHDYTIILMTARPYDMYTLTTQQLKDFHLFYDDLVMGVGNGVRYLINDTKPYADIYCTAHAITIERNKGLKNITV